MSERKKRLGIKYYFLFRVMNKETVFHWRLLDLAIDVSRAGKVNVNICLLGLKVVIYWR